MSQPRLALIKYLCDSLELLVIRICCCIKNPWLEIELHTLPPQASGNRNYERAGYDNKNQIQDSQ